MNKIKILFIDGSWVDFDKPQGFDMAAFVHGVRSIGFILTNSFYVPVGMVKGILDMSMSEAQYGTTGPPPPANAPTTETRQ